LVVDLYDPKSQKMIWRGTVNTGLRSNQDPAKRTERLQQAVAKLLSKFPPQ